MRILIDIGHPAHVHLFKHFANQMIGEGNVVLFTCREKEFEKQLLIFYGFQFKILGPKFNKKILKIWGLIRYVFMEFVIGFKFKVDIFLSHGSMYSAIASWLLFKPHISLEDSGNLEQVKIYKPFTKAILTPDILSENLGHKQIRYNAFHELAYLNPKYFIPDDSIHSKLNIDSSEKYCLIRFVSWDASHDTLQKGLNDEEKKILISTISKRMKVFITSEPGGQNDYNGLKLKLTPEKIHDVIYFASLVVSEGATIASEAGVLGTTSVYISSIARSYCEDLEKYGLVFNHRDASSGIKRVTEILKGEEMLQKQTNKRDTLLKEKIDITSFLVWFITNWPESFDIMQYNPDYQYNFK